MTDLNNIQLTSEHH